MCLRPIVVNYGNDTVGCGKCLRCRMSRIQSWVGRLALEASAHKWTTIRTLTYGGTVEPVLRYSDVQQYFKSLRQSGAQFRFFCAGEYGDMFNRPHWHVIMFGIEPRILRMRYHDEYWSHGFVFDDVASVSAFRYCCKYVMKNDYSDFTLSRMSLKPGIGLDRIRMLAQIAARTGIASWPDRYVLHGRTYPLREGGLTAFKKGYINSGGSPPVERTQLERKLATLELVCDWGTRIEQKRNYNIEWMLRRGELLAPSYAKKGQS